MLFLLACIDAVVLFLHLPLIVFVVSAVLLVLLVMWPVDAMTVRLVQAGRWRGWLRGYEI